ncbi:MAG: hypothetical protein Kow0099_20390 [Candidatus Abyssubacteria bacterium]
MLAGPTSKNEYPHRLRCSCSEHSDINEAVRLMEEHKIRRILVTNDQDQVVGILSLGDLAVKLSEQQACEVLREISKPARPER